MPPRLNRGPSTAYARYASARRAVRTARRELVAATAAMGDDPSDRGELLELLRELEHTDVDRDIDAEAVRHPSPTRLIFRAKRYQEIA